MLKKIGVILLILFFPSVFPASALIYKNGGCGHCSPYVEGLVQMLEKNGYGNYVVKDFMQDTEVRKEVMAVQERFDVPLRMQGHMLVLIDDKYLFEGHVPANLIESYLKNPKGQVVVTQDSMDKPTTYEMLMKGKVETCPIDQPIEKCEGHDTGVNASAILQNPLIPLGLLVLGGAALLYSIRVN
ncbi:TPA: hypothetical protein HA225_02640 [Candidatus Micrarchaeota archaeon]|nr:hypothetical protein [Candidatus Micrarchaeota archaeon]